MQLHDYIQKHRYSREVSGIRERWQGRIEKNKWHLQGEDGAAKYLVQYGKNIKLPKLLALAHYAENQGYDDVAAGFYMYAARLEGVPIDKRMSSGFDALKHRMQKMPPVLVFAKYIEFPDEWQPGIVKFDGQANEVLAFLTQNTTLYQLIGQEGALASLEFRLDEGLRILATTLGTLVLRAKLAWVDFDNCEHDTAEKSIEANLALGFETILPEPLLTIADCLYCSTGNDLADVENIAEGLQYVRTRSKTHV